MSGKYMAQSDKYITNGSIDACNRKDCFKYANSETSLFRRFWQYWTLTRAPCFKQTAALINCECFVFPFYQIVRTAMCTAVRRNILLCTDTVDMCK